MQTGSPLGYSRRPFSATTQTITFASEDLEEDRTGRYGESHDKVSYTQAFGAYNTGTRTQFFMKIKAFFTRS